jgi:predicted transcriptional regulator
MDSSIKEKIIETLRETPQGLNILDISRIIGKSRCTTSKYVYVLSSENAILQREVGTAKMCYIASEYVESDCVETHKELVCA